MTRCYKISEDKKSKECIWKRAKGALDTSAVPGFDFLSIKHGRMAGHQSLSFSGLMP